MIFNEVVRLFKNRLNGLAEESGKAQKTIADEIGISEQNLSNYLKADVPRLPRVDMLLRMADYFNVSVDYLLGRSKAKSPDNERIMQRLGLTEAAIQALEVMHENAKNGKDSGAAVAGVNLLLSEEEGREMLNNVGAYLLLDFNKAYGVPGVDKSTNALHFLPVPEAASYGVVPDLCETIKTESIGDALVTSIGISLQRLREGIHHVNQEDSK